MGSELQREIKQTRPFGSVAQEAAIGLLRTADVVRRRIAATLAPEGVTPQQYNVLRILRGAGPDGLPTLEIVARLIEQAPGITRLCDALERRGWLSRLRLSTDRRVVRCRVTPAGLALLTRLDEPIAKADATALGSLRPAELTLLIGLLDRIRAAGDAALPSQSPTPSP